MHVVVDDQMLCNCSGQADDDSDDDRLSRVAAVVVVFVVGRRGLAERHIAAGECRANHCSHNGRGRERGSICSA